MIPERYQHKDAWPHTFTRSSNKKDSHKGTIYQYFCAHCFKIWWPDLESKPVGACPARTDRGEYRRMGVER